MLGEHWRRLGFAFDAAYSGTMQRQRVTGERALAGLGGDPSDLRVDAAFNEYDHQGLIRAYLPVLARERPEFSVAAHELLTDPKRFQTFFNLVVGAWLKDQPGEAPISERWDEFCARCVAGLLGAARTGERVVVFTSGGVIMAALREALRVSDDIALRLNWRILNASVHVFSVGSRGLNLVGFNDITHLQAAQDERLLTYR